MKVKPAAGPADLPPARPIDSGRALSIVTWIVALGLASFAMYLGWCVATHRPLFLFAQSSKAKALEQVSANQSKSSNPEAGDAGFAVPAFTPAQIDASIFRQSDLHTTIPNRPDDKVHEYTVVKGDSVFEIASRFKIKPETVLWANYDQLNDNPDMISVGMPLLIPTANGVLYTWRAGDTVEGVASKFKATQEDILAWTGNHIDLVDPKIEPGALVFIPGGFREFRMWLVPTIARGNAGVSPELYGAGACSGNYSGAYGSGVFIWPTANHVLSGNDYWSGHLGVDLSTGEGNPIYAADSGVVVFSGWANGGYGNMVMIDHGNSYQTLYAHMSSVVVGCGQSVSQGATIGYSGSTGNSTGAHLHFEVRYQGGFVSPWYVLPAP